MYRVKIGEIKRMKRCNEKNVRNGEIIIKKNVYNTY